MTRLTVSSFQPYNFKTTIYRLSGQFHFQEEKNIPLICSTKEAIPSPRRITMKHFFLSLAVALLFSGWWNPAIVPAEPYLLTVQQLKAGLDKATQPKQKGFVLVDVRSPDEHMSGFIPGTDFNIDFREIETRHRELKTNLDQHIVVYCQSGHRSNIAAETLMGLGYQHVYNVEGSMNSWEEAGYPIKRPN
jgi:rhodanese-related sulfurtransferase